jgi:hypothetical protein
LLWRFLYHFASLQSLVSFCLTPVESSAIPDKNRNLKWNCCFKDVL